MEPWPEFDDHYARLVRFALRLTGSEETARDIVQETCLRCVQGGPTAGEPATLVRWLFVVARNLCFSHLRSRGRHPQVPLDDRHPPADRATGPAAGVLAAERRELVRRAVARLPLDLREAIMLREYEDLSYAEIVEITGAPMGTVKSRIARARQMLRAELTPLLEERS